MNIKPTGVSPSNELMESLCGIDAIQTDQLSHKSGNNENKRNGVHSLSLGLLLRQGSVWQNDLFSGFTKWSGSMKSQLLPQLSMILGVGRGGGNAK